MSKITLCNLNQDIFQVSANQTADNSQERADIVAAGRLLNFDYAAHGQATLYKALSSTESVASAKLTQAQYAEMNQKFQRNHLMYAARMADAVSGGTTPGTWEDFKRVFNRYCSDPIFRRVLQGVYQEIVTPILPAVYSDAVGVFAEMVNVGFGETYAITVSSNDIPIFQDSAWGSSRSVPANRFYEKQYTLNPRPVTCEYRAKWTQLIANGMDFGRYFSNITAGMYAYTMGVWKNNLVAATSDTTLIPSALTGTFNSTNWMNIANKLAALNNTSISNLFATGSMVPLSKVLPTQVTGSTNVNMDAAIATLLGADYTRSGYLGEYLGVRLLPLTDAIVPGTQNGSVTTILPNDRIWMMAGNGRKPMTIAFNRDMPITIELTPEQTTSFEYVVNITMALDIVSVFSSKIATLQIA